MLIELSNTPILYNTVIESHSKESASIPVSYNMIAVTNLLTPLIFP